MAKKIYAVCVCLMLFLPSISFAADPIPEFNPLCWTRPQCEDIRSKILRQDPQTIKANAQDGWVEGDVPCNKPGWGKCLPANQTVTEIAFGGRRQFIDIGDFVQTLYKYGLGIGAVIAAVMVVVAGVQWITSGGNSEMISSAKKRIGGAISGLVLLYLSYFILNTLNPALVNLRLPQVWLIRPQSIVPEMCNAAPSTTFFAKAADTTDQKTPIPSTAQPDFSKGISYGDLMGTPAGFCGHRFFMKDGGNSTCFGSYCKDGEVCVNFDYQGKDPKQKYFCAKGMLAGNISGVLSIAAAPVMDGGNNIKLIALCANGTIEEVDDVDVSEKGDAYSFAPNKSIETICGAKSDVLGFYLGVEVNDETGGFTGGLIEGSNWSWGIDDWFAVGQTTDKSHVCSVNLSAIAYELSAGKPAGCSNNRDSLQCSCSTMSIENVRKKIAKDKPVDIMSHLIKLEDLEKGYTCDVVVDRSNFPAVDNNFMLQAIEGVGVGAALGGKALGPYGALGGGAIGFLNGFDDPTSCFDKQ